jgi:hypothetical protein
MKVRETNDWLLPEELAAADPAPLLLLFDQTEGLRDVAAFEFAAERHEGVRFLKINVDENPSVLKRYHVRRLPTIVLYVGGREAGRRGGALGDQDISDLLAKKQRRGG